MRETPSVVPDRIEPVVAYRYWSIEDIPILSGWGWSNCQWPITTPLAAYHMYVSSSIKYTSIPDKHSIYNCKGSKSKYDTKDFTLGLYRCGIHAYKTSCTLGTGRYFTDTVVGQVYLWGLIVEHESGYRAEFAYPKCLYLDGNKDDKIRMIARNYRIPAVEPPAMEPQPHFNSLVDLQRDTYNAISRDTGVQG